ncbi:hypothetical protein [Dactylosporangium sp. CA-092794]|uniref:hypothetical protein n=1 Tax=Dactylosporangium sp. CA-092794 TaxID=3239929 RepID=UPI003D8A7877
MRNARRYLHHCPLPGMDAIRTLEPLVNLARLHIRAGRGHRGHDLLLRLEQAGLIAESLMNTGSR